MKGRHAWMLKLAHDLRLLEKALPQLSIVLVRRQEHLDRERTVELSVEHAIDHPHPPVPNLRLDAIAAHARRHVGDLAIRRRHTRSRLAVRRRSPPQVILGFTTRVSGNLFLLWTLRHG